MTAEKPADPNYTALPGHKLIEVLGDDAAKWAAAFRQHATKLGYSDMDEGWLIGWFANAIEHSSDVRHWRGHWLPCPICGFRDSCDHTVLERARAAHPGLVIPSPDSSNPKPQ